MKTIDNIYFDATLSNIYVLEYSTNEITFGFNDNGISRKQLQRMVFDTCLKYGAIKQIEFNGNRVFVKFENNIT